MKQYISETFFKDSTNIKTDIINAQDSEDIKKKIAFAGLYLDNTFIFRYISKGLRNGLYKTTDNDLELETTLPAGYVREDEQDKLDTIKDCIVIIASFAITTGFDFISGSFSNSQGDQSFSESLDFQNSLEQLKQTITDLLSLYTFGDENTLVRSGSYKVAYDKNILNQIGVLSDQRFLTETGLVDRLTDTTWTTGRDGIYLIPKNPQVPSEGIFIGITGGLPPTPIDRVFTASTYADIDTTKRDVVYQVLDMVGAPDLNGVPWLNNEKGYVWINSLGTLTSEKTSEILLKDILMNVGDISTNGNNISTNTSAITALQLAIAQLETPAYQATDYASSKKFTKTSDSQLDLIIPNNDPLLMNPINVGSPVSSQSFDSDTSVYPTVLPSVGINAATAIPFTQQIGTFGRTETKIWNDGTNINIRINSAGFGVPPFPDNPQLGLKKLATLIPTATVDLTEYVKKSMTGNQPTDEIVKRTFANEAEKIKVLNKANEITAGKTFRVPGAGKEEWYPVIWQGSETLPNANAYFTFLIGGEQEIGTVKVFWEGGNTSFVRTSLEGQGDIEIVEDTTNKKLWIKVQAFSEIWMTFYSNNITGLGTAVDVQPNGNVLKNYTRKEIKSGVVEDHRADITKSMENGQAPLFISNITNSIFPILTIAPAGGIRIMNTDGSTTDISQSQLVAGADELIVWT